jgi:hypothetical protein
MTRTAVDQLNDGVQLMTLSPARPSPALKHRPTSSITHYNLDFSLSTALGHLVHQLLIGLTRIYPAQKLSDLRLRLTSALSELFAQTWDPSMPYRGSGSRSLICSRQMGLPRVLVEAAGEAGISVAVWRDALARKGDDDERAKKTDEWEAWCDPGSVAWRYGGWDWEDPKCDIVTVAKGERSWHLRPSCSALIARAHDHHLVRLGFAQTASSDPQLIGQRDSCDTCAALSCHPYSRSCSVPSSGICHPP